MEKPGGPEGTPRRLNPKVRSKLDLIRPFGGDPKVARMARKRKRCVRPFPTFWQEGTRELTASLVPLPLTGENGDHKTQCLGFTVRFPSPKGNWKGSLFALQLAL